MKAVVTGAKGMLGQDLCPVFEDAGIFVNSFGSKELDVTNYDETRQIIGEISPQIIVNLAAYTNVDKTEEDYDNALRVNYEGAKNLAKVSKETGAILIHASTDYVFDGTKNSPYAPSDKTNPINKYGLSKLKGEEAIIENTDKFYIVRTSWLYGGLNGFSGNHFVKTMLNLKDKDEIKVVNDQTGSPTYTVDLALGMLMLLSKPFGIYHITGEGETTWYNFAKEIFDIEKLNVNLKPCTTKDFSRPARRPAYSVLENSIQTRHWKDALKEYLDYTRSLNKGNEEL